METLLLLPDALGRWLQVPAEDWEGPSDCVLYCVATDILLAADGAKKGRRRRGTAVRVGASDVALWLAVSDGSLLVASLDLETLASGMFERDSGDVNLWEPGANREDDVALSLRRIAVRGATETEGWPGHLLDELMAGE